MKNVSLFKKSGSSSWFIQYTDDDGHRKQISTRTSVKSEALSFLSKLKSEPRKPKEKPKSLSAFTTDFLLYAQSQYRPPTVLIYKFALSLLQSSVGNVPMASITAHHVDKWKAEMRSKRSRRGGELSIVYINIQFRALKAAFNTALRWGIINANPFLSCKRLPASGMEPSSLSINEFSSVLSKIENDTIRDLAIFAINTGARIGEILSLRWEAVDVANRQIEIRSTKTFKTKTGKNRIVPLTHDAFNVIQKRQKLMKGGLVFHRNGYPLLGNTVAHKFKLAVRAAGLPESIHFHSLRHSSASLLMQSGASISAVKDLLGHSSIATTQIYIEPLFVRTLGMMSIRA